MSNVRKFVIEYAVTDEGPVTIDCREVGVAENRKKFMTELGGFDGLRVAKLEANDFLSRSMRSRQREISFKEASAEKERRRANPPRPETPEVRLKEIEGELFGDPDAVQTADPDDLIGISEEAISEVRQRQDDIDEKKKRRK